MRTPTNAYRPPTTVWVGKTIETTDGRKGVVEAAWPVNGGKVGLNFRGEHGESFYTDNEHATIKREG